MYNQVMNKKIIIGEKLQSNNYYLADSKLINVYGGELSRFGLPQKDAYGAGDGYKVAFYLENVQNVTLDFNGATLFLHGKIQPFIIDNCKNVTIKNVKVEYERPPFSEGEVVDVGKDYFTAKFNEKCPFKIVDGNIVFYGKDWENDTLSTVDFVFVQAFDGIIKRGKGLFLASIGKTQPPTTRPFKRIHLTPEKSGDLVKFKGYDKDILSVGDRFVISHEDRSLSNVFIRNSENIRLENYRIVNGQGMGILPVRVKNLYIDRLIMNNDEASALTVTNSADAIHAVACSGDFKITNSVIGGMIDDGLNVHSYFYHADKTVGNVIYAESKSPDGTAMQNFAAGDKIAVYNQNFLEEKEEFIIKKVETYDEKTFKLTVEKSAETVKRGDLIENLSAQANLTIDNCKFINGNTHIRLQTRGKSVIKNSVIELKILLSGDTSYWFESSPVNDLTFENCSFKTMHANVLSCPQVYVNEKAKYYHENVKFINCVFDNDNAMEYNLTDKITVLDTRAASGGKIKVKLINCGEFVSDGGVELTRETAEKKEPGLN